MKEMKLTTWERIQLIQCIPPTGHTIEEVRKHLRVADILELTEEEKKLVGWREIQTTQGMSTSWGVNAEVEPDYEFEISFEDADYEHLKNLVGQRSEWPTSKLTLDIYDKLEE
jgi:hypothetical protein